MKHLNLFQVALGAVVALAMTSAARAQLTPDQSKQSIAINRSISSAKKLASANQNDQAAAAVAEIEKQLAEFAAGPTNDAHQRVFAARRSTLDGLRALLEGRGLQLAARAVLASAAADSGSADSGPGEWTRFRGPNGTGVSMADTIPVKWTDKDYNWKVAIPGQGHSSPVLWGDKIFLTTSFDDGNKREVMCLSANDGKVLWTKDFPSKTHNKHKFNSFASATPCVDADHVYAVFSTPDSYTLIALDHNGKEVWQDDFGNYESQHSCGASPIVYKDLVVLANEQDGPSSLIAVDRKTGELKWRTERRVAQQGTAYSTPCVFSQNGNEILIFNSKAHGVSGVDPATGKTLWDAPLLDKRSCSSPIFVGDTLFGSCGSGGGGNYIIAVKPGGKLAYQIKGSAEMPYVCTPIANGELVFFWSDKGVLTCVDAASGQVHFQERIGGNFFSSPIRVRDKLYGISTDGECVVVEAGKEYKELARIDLGEACHATPAVAGGKMYIRTFGHLMSLGGKK